MRMTFAISPMAIHLRREGLFKVAWLLKPPTKRFLFVFISAHSHNNGVDYNLVVQI